MQLYTIRGNQYEKQKNKKKRRENYYKKKKGKRKKEKKAMKDNILSILSNVFSFGESITVKSQEQSEMSQYIPSWIPVIVISSILMKYMSSCFDRVVAAWTHKFISWKES